MNVNTLARSFSHAFSSYNSTNWTKWVEICSMWDFMSVLKRTEVLREYKDIVDWHAVSRFIHTIDLDGVREFRDYIMWGVIDHPAQKFSLNFLREFRDKFRIEVL